MAVTETSERLGGAAFLSVPAFDCFVWALDNYARLELLVKLHDQLPAFLFSPATVFLCMCIGLWLVYRANQRQLKRINLEPRPLVDSSGTEYRRRQKPDWLLSVGVMFIVALVATPLLAIAYSLAYKGTPPAIRHIMPPAMAYRETPPTSTFPRTHLPQPTYNIGNATRSIVNQGSPNYGNQTVTNVDTSRRLNQEQIAAIISSGQSVCAALPMIKVTAANGNQEAQRYAYDFIEALRRGGCKADLALPIPGLTPDVSGIHIAVRDFNNIDPSAKALGTLLSDARVSFQTNPIKPDFFPEETFVLVIGAKE